MAAPLARLTIVPYLQAFNAAASTLRVNILLAPLGDPRDALNAGLPGAPSPPFAGSSIVLRAHLSTDAATVPTIADVAAVPGTFPLAMPPTQTPIFDAVAAQFTITKPPVAPERKAANRLGKYLPESYRSAFAFVEPRTRLAVTDDSYACARKCPPKDLPPVMPPDPAISWGEVFAALLRQPPAARAVGLIHTVTLNVGAAFADAGYLFFTLDQSSDFAAQAAADPHFVRVFATRVPRLLPLHKRAVFTPVLFPVAEDAAAAALLGPLDTVFGEAVKFDDGFAKIVHCAQPTTADGNADGGPGMPPATDLGIKIGWDDEDVLVTLNRAMCPDEPGKGAVPEAPPGFSGWCVDVREKGSSEWTSLCRIEGDGIDFGNPAAVLPAYEQELAVEVQPSRLAGSMWMQPWHTSWRGGSLVVRTEMEQQLAGIRNATSAPYRAIGLAAVSLRYRNTYEFRVRMRDATGGGPTAGDRPETPGEAPIASWQMRRYVPPKDLRVADGPVDADGVLVSCSVRRPMIRWPEASFTGFPGALARLEAIQSAIVAGGPPADVAIPDPDADFLEIKVLVRQPRFDRRAREDGFVELYTTYRAFPALTAMQMDPPVTVTFDWKDTARLADLTWEVPSRPMGDATGPVPLPTNREVLVEMRAVGRLDMTYFGSHDARFGPVFRPGVMKKKAAAEPPILGLRAPIDAAAAVFLRPDAPEQPADSAVSPSNDPHAVYVRRFAAAADLVEGDGAIMGSEGRRTVFGCFGLRHVMAPDNGSFRLAAVADLPNQWLSTVRLPIERDWTWTGAGHPAFIVRRRIVHEPTGYLAFDEELGTIAFSHAINRQAALGRPDRSQSELVIVDAFAPPLGPDGFPYALDVTYTIVAVAGDGGRQTVEIRTRLPVTTPPRDVPKLASAGHAFSAYAILGDYQETETRRRMLWLEFEAPPADPRDLYFVRVLAQSPDPMLLTNQEPLADPPEYAKMVIDPELVRVVRPGQSDDFAGLAAMQPLIPAKTAGERPRHFLVPLPSHLTPESPELFGFFTYEIRVGHARGTTASPFWSTAQGRFGSPIVIEGVQHPAPTLPCFVQRNGEGVYVCSEHAVAVHEGRRLVATPVGTEVWFAAYARVPQADGATNRNIQIDLRRGISPRRERALIGQRQACAYWSAEEFEAALARWGLPRETPAGFVAIELLPEPNGTFADPLGGDLGDVRILRTSRLVDAGDLCCH